MCVSGPYLLVVVSPTQTTYIFNIPGVAGVVFKHICYCCSIPILANFMFCLSDTWRNRKIKIETQTHTEARNHINLIPGWVKHFSRVWLSGDQWCLSSEGPQDQVQNKYRAIQFERQSHTLVRKAPRLHFMDLFRHKYYQLTNHHSL